ncbi:MAG: hypothetical protein U0I09_08630 [Bacteroidaceae bacterium]|nr:hypothetical protein [Bacteroidaceae bacterium]MEE0119618.1 hypothetical protein [Bacteroidaceae bacterium]MEE1288757.1 hypothetical protein [Bacteroidaceae bacterium]
MYRIICNMKGSRTMAITDEHLETIDKYYLFSNLLDSNGIVDEMILEKLQLNLRALLERTGGEEELVNLAKDVVFHENMKALALHQLILLYLDWQKDKIAANVPTE